MDEQDEVSMLATVIADRVRLAPVRRLEAWEQIDHEANDCAVLVVWAMNLGMRIRCNDPATHEADGALLCGVHVKALGLRDLTVEEFGELRELDYKTEALALCDGCGGSPSECLALPYGKKCCPDCSCRLVRA